MCGRFGLFSELDELAEQFSFAPAAVRDGYRPRWNIPPTAPALAIRADGDRRAASIMRWGWTPPRGQAGGGAPRLLCNARAETVAQRPAFRSAFATRRCLAPANGFYEWRPGPGRSKTPLWFHHNAGAAVAFAGLWFNAQTADGGQESCVIITCAANGLVAPAHNRMPVILEPAQFDTWLSDQSPADALLSLLDSREWPRMAAYEVSAAVNRTANEGPQLVAPFVKDLDDRQPGLL